MIFIFGDFDHRQFAHLYPTLRLKILAGHGCVIIGRFAELPHAVLGGDGERLSVVYTVHLSMTTGMLPTHLGPRDIDWSALVN